MATEFGATTANDIAVYILNATAMPAYGASGGTILYVGLYNADPLASGNQTSHETAYGAYARVAVNRNSGGWTVASGVGSNAATITFPQCTSGTDTITHVAIGTAASGAGQILWAGTLNSSMAISLNITPTFAAGQLQVTVA